MLNFSEILPDFIMKKNLSKLATETLEKGVKYVVLTTKASEGRR